MKDFVLLCGHFGKSSACMYSNVNSCGVGCVALCVTWLNVLTLLLYIYWILLCFLYVWSACYWKRSVNNPPFWLWFCLFLLFTLSSMFQSYVLLPWILLSKISLLRVHLIIIMKIPSLVQLMYLGLKSTFWDIDIAIPVLLQVVHLFHHFTFNHSLLS